MVSLRSANTQESQYEELLAATLHKGGTPQPMTTTQPTSLLDTVIFLTGVAIFCFIASYFAIGMIRRGMYTPRPPTPYDITAPMRQYLIAWSARQPTAFAGYYWMYATYQDGPTIVYVQHDPKDHTEHAAIVYQYFGLPATYAVHLEPKDTLWAGPLFPPPALHYEAQEG